MSCPAGTCVAVGVGRETKMRRERSLQRQRRRESRRAGISSDSIISHASSPSKMRPEPAHRIKSCGLSAAICPAAAWLEHRRAARQHCCSCSCSGSPGFRPNKWVISWRREQPPAAAPAIPSTLADLRSVAAVRLAANDSRAPCKIARAEAPCTAHSNSQLAPAGFELGKAGESLNAGRGLCIGCQVKVPRRRR